MSETITNPDGTQRVIKRKPAGGPGAGEFDKHKRGDSGVVLESLAMDITGVDPEDDAPETDIYGNKLGRGGFPRDRTVGRRARVSDPNGATLKDGTPKFISYSAPSGVAISSSTAALDKWKQKSVLVGALTDDELRERLLADLAEAEESGKSAMDVVGGYLDEAMEAGQANLARDRGSVAHFITECQDQGISPLEAVDSEEARRLGLDEATITRIAEGWSATLEKYGLESTHVEVNVVNDELKTAGTADRVVRLNKPLTAQIGDDTVELPTGTHLIADLKTGTAYLDKSGKPMYTGKFAAQLASYAGGVPYDTRTAKRSDWPAGQKPREDVGMVIYADLEGVANGTNTDGFKVFFVDLNQGKDYVTRSRDLKVAEASANKGASRLLD